MCCNLLKEKLAVCQHIRLNKSYIVHSKLYNNGLLQSTKFLQCDEINSICTEPKYCSFPLNLWEPSLSVVLCGLLPCHTILFLCLLVFRIEKVHNEPGSVFVFQCLHSACHIYIYTIYGAWKSTTLHKLK